MLTFPESKIALFTDIHFGIKRDNELKLQYAVDFVKWMTARLKALGIKQVIFLGDWFNSRNSISVRVLHESYMCLKYMSDNGLNIILICGNHDLYYKMTAGITSIGAFEDIPNVKIIQESCQVLQLAADRRALLVPWGGFDETREFPRGKFDVMMGHLNFVGAEHLGHVNTDGIKGDTLTEISKLCFSGHFHIRKEYAYKNGKIITVGCPLELNWADINNEKGFYVYDSVTGTYTFEKNTVSPRHVKVFWSDILKKKANILSDVKGNIVKLCVDDKYEYSQIVKVIDFINRLKPIHNFFEVEYSFRSNFHNLVQEVSSDGQNIVNLPVIDQITEYLKNHNIEQLSVLDREKMDRLIRDYHSRAQLEI